MDELLSGIEKDGKVEPFWKGKREFSGLKSGLDLPSKEVVVARKLRFYPTTKQKRYFARCFGAHRFFYNRAVDEFNQVKGFGLKKFDLFKKLIPLQRSSDHWSKNIPIHTNREGITDFVTALKAEKTRYNKKIWIADTYDKPKPELSSFDFKTKKGNQTFHFSKSALTKDLYLFKRRVKSKLRLSKRDNEYLESLIKNRLLSDSIISKEQNKYFLVAVSKQQSKPTQKDKLEFVGLDPGIRTFLTYADNAGQTGKLPIEFKRHSKKLESLPDLSRTRKRRSLLKTKIRNIVRFNHIKTALWSVNRYKVIFLPEFKVKTVISKTGSLNKRSKRQLSLLSHFKFKNILIHLADKSGSKVVICNESYTTKTCNQCGGLNEVGTKEVFDCDHCGHQDDGT